MVVVVVVLLPLEEHPNTLLELDDARENLLVLKACSRLEELEARGHLRKLADKFTHISH